MSQNIPHKEKFNGNLSWFWAFLEQLHMKLMVNYDTCSDVLSQVIYASRLQDDQVLSIVVLLMPTSVIQWEIIDELIAFFVAFYGDPE